MVNDVSLVKVYLDYQTKYENNMVKVNCVNAGGSFFEMYGIDNKEKIGNLKKIAEILNIILAKRKSMLLRIV